jgi:hypothetical protein
VCNRTLYRPQLCERLFLSFGQASWAHLGAVDIEQAVGVDEPTGGRHAHRDDLLQGPPLVSTQAGGLLAWAQANPPARITRAASRLAVQSMGLSPYF